jgi:transposase
MPTPTRTTSKAPVHKGVRSRRDFTAMEARRMRAADLFTKGEPQADIARELGVAHQTVSDWHEKWIVGGKKALKAAGRAGRPPKVGPTELAKVERALERGPKANNFPTDLWTLARVADVIESVTGVRYHPGHVWRVLRQMGWTRQRPARRAAERDDEAIERWVNDRWPRVKKTQEAGTPGSSSRTRAGSASSPR